MSDSDKLKINMFDSMYNYQSPIELIVNQLHEKYENDCVSVCQQYGFNVDREELAKALAYDRSQYDKGFRAGYRQALKEQAELRNSILGLLKEWETDNVG